jgi:hypothetical protein
MHMAQEIHAFEEEEGNENELVYLRDVLMR